MYFCERIGLFLTSLCKKVSEYIINNGLQNEQPLTRGEVAEDFRILNRPDTEEEKSDVEKSIDELADIYQKSPPEESEPKPPGGGLFD